MRMTSNRELARQLGVSETAVRRAEKAGRIKREADGAWDPARVTAAWADNTDQAQQRPARSGRPTGTCLDRHVLDHLTELAEVQPSLR
jgi:DeoR/GlpR family transcriptional regulator of sugar metabolism